MVCLYNLCTALLINILICNILRSQAIQHEVNLCNTELSFCCYYDFLTPEKAIQEDLVINKQDLVKDKLFHLSEPFQLMNSRDKIKGEQKQS